LGKGAGAGGTGRANRSAGAAAPAAAGGAKAKWAWLTLETVTKYFLSITCSILTKNKYILLLFAYFVVKMLKK
jgi:hypothetical protein